MSTEHFMENEKSTVHHRINKWLLLIMVFGWFLGCFAASASIPEPETLFYGKVINRSGGQEQLLTQGTMEWMISNHDDTVAYLFTTELESLGDGQFSYRLRIPHEAVLAGLTVTDEKLPLDSQNIRYDHTSVTVNGIPATIVPPADDFITVRQNSRMTPFRIDLEIVLELDDTDGDGMPDWWEDMYNFEKDNPDDAGEDPDDDAATNLDEYIAGTDPTVSNRLPEIAADSVVIYEAAVTAVYIELHDSDSDPADIVYTLTQAPNGGVLYFRDGSGTADEYGLNTGIALRENDTFTQEDVQSGKIQFSHDDVAVEHISFGVSVIDENPDHLPVEGTITADIVRPSALDGSEAALWVDANYEAAKAVELTVWQDRSGPKEWADGSTAPFDMTEAHGETVIIGTNGPYGKPALELNGSFFKGPSPDEAAVLDSENRTLFAVFNAEGVNPQKIVNTPDFEIAVSGDDQNRAGYLRYGATDSSVYSHTATANRWVLATVRSSNNNTIMELDGRWGGGPFAEADDTILGHSFSIGGATVSRFDMDQGGWVTEDVDIFKGRIAEIIAFDYSMDTEQRRKINWHLLSKWFGYVICDGSGKARNQTLIAPDGTVDVRGVDIRVPSSGQNAETYRSGDTADRSYIIIGGPGNDTLSGGGESDILYGGAGDDILTGGTGADTFVIEDTYDGNDIITDFDATQHDAVDLTSILNGASTLLSDYIRLSSNGTDTTISIDADGNGSDYNDMVITLRQNMFGDEHLPFLWANGSLITGGIRYPLEIDIQASNTDITENSDAPATFTIGFSGSVIPKNIEIPLTVDGTARWKNDYILKAERYDAVTGQYELVELQNLSVPLQLRPGDASFEIRLIPIADDETEGVEDVELILLEQKAFYDLSSAYSAGASISDGPILASITALRGKINEGGGIGDVLTITLSRASDEALEISLQITGSADNGKDFSYISDKVTIPAGHREIEIPVKAYPDQTVEPVEIIEVLIVEGNGYTPGDPEKATLSLVDPEGPDAPPITGNLNDDHTVDFKDAILALQISAGITPSVWVYFEADVNGDGRPALPEALYVLQVAAELRN